MKMTNLPKTIQIFLPAGDARGIRIAEITTRIVQAIEVPRSLLSDFLKMPESSQVAVYMLFGQADGVSVQQVYIGQSGNLGKRLSQHNVEKDFWQRAVVLISRTNSLTQTHALFLEWYCIQQAKAAGRYQTDVNKNGGSRPYTPSPLEADCLEIFDTSKILLATLGFPVFDPLAKASTDMKPAEFFFCKRAGPNMVGEYTEEGFVVLKGSIGKAEVSKSFVNHAFAKLREELISSGKLVIDDDFLRFNEDVLFSSPSAAAAVACGAPANGWHEWKNENGKTLNEIKRVPLANSGGSE